MSTQPSAQSQSESRSTAPIEFPTTFIEYPRQRTLTNLLVGMEKMGIRHLMRDDPGAYQLFHALVMIANATFDLSGRFPDELSLTATDIIKEAGANSERTLQRRKAKLLSYKIKGKPIIHITGNSYRINYDLLLTYDYSPRKAIPVQPKVEKVKEISSAKYGEAHPYIREREEEEPKPTLSVISTGNSKEVAKGSGSFVKIQAEELPIVKEIVRLGVQKGRVLQAILDKGEEWVQQTYGQFIFDRGGKHRMENEAAVLWHRLGDYEESWKKGIVGSVGVGKTPDHRKLPEELVEKYQQAIDLLSPDEEDLQMAYLAYVKGLQGEVEVLLGKRLDFEIVRAYLHMPVREVA